MPPFARIALSNQKVSLSFSLSLSTFEFFRIHVAKRHDVLKKLNIDTSAKNDVAIVEKFESQLSSWLKIRTRNSCRNENDDRRKTRKARGEIRNR